MKINRIESHLQISERENVSEFSVLKTQGLKVCEQEGRKGGGGSGNSLFAAGSLQWLSSYEETTLNRSPYSER